MPLTGCFCLKKTTTWLSFLAEYFFFGASLSLRHSWQKKVGYNILCPLNTKDVIACWGKLYNEVIRKAIITLRRRKSRFCGWSKSTPSWIYFAREGRVCPLWLKDAGSLCYAIAVVKNLDFVVDPNRRHLRFIREGPRGSEFHCDWNTRGRYVTLSQAEKFLILFVVDSNRRHLEFLREGLGAGGRAFQSLVSKRRASCDKICTVEEVSSSLRPV